MADAAWVLLHTLDEKTYNIIQMAHAEADLSQFRPYVPSGPDDPRAAAGVQVVVEQIDGSVHYVTDSFAALAAAVKAKPV